ncbi:MAG: PAS domain S-box protein [Geobacteraceae bacterium]|nr:PAS domain S-box protein [Geobacteraceae bacterium]
MATDNRTREDLLAEIENLRFRLDEAEETLSAIGRGEVDAFVVTGPEGEQVFTLKGAEQPYRVLVETMNEGAATLAADGTILYCNNRLATMLQVPLERLIGTRLVSYVAPAHHALFSARLRNCFHESAENEIAMVTGTGDFLPVLISCSELNLYGSRGISAVVTDLTQQKRNEQVLASERLARAIIEQAGEAIIVCDEGGSIIRASQAAHELCGENPLLKPFNELFHLRIIDSDCLFSVATPLGGGSFECVEVEFDRKDGRIYHLLLNATPLMSEQARIIGCVVTLTDFTECKQAEEALRESEERFRVAQEMSMDAFTILTAVRDELGAIVDFRWVYVNPEACRILRRPPDEFIGRRLLELLPGNRDQSDLFTHYVSIVETGQPQDYELRYQAEGIDGWFRNMSVKLGDGVAVCFADITERKRAEEAISLHNEILKGVNAVLSAALSSRTESDLGVACLEVVQALTKSKFGFIGEINENCLEDIAISNPGWDSCAGLDPNGHRRPPGNFKIHGLYGRVLSDGKTLFTNDPATHSDSIGLPPGHPPLDAFLGVPLISEGRTVGMIAVANRPAGYTTVEQEIVETLAPAILEAFMRKRAEEELKKLNQELESRVAERTEELAATIVNLQVEMAEREKLEQQLMQSQKMESIGLLAGGVAHDFNNLLTAIAGYGQIIKENIPGDDELLQESIGQILAGSERAAELTRNLLTFSRKQVMNRKPVKVESIIHNAGKFIRRVIGEDIEFRTVHSGSELIVTADKGQLEQVLMNLAVNSRDAMLHGGCLSISTREVKVKEGSEALYDLSAPGRYAQISFADTGTGIERATMERIFEPFYTTKEVGKGTGLGLSIVYGIVKQHDGAILASSEPGKGTTFDIYLPLIGGSETRQEIKPVAPAAGGSETLLIAEDEVIVKIFLMRTLERAGYRVIVASDGAEAVSRFMEHDDISLVLTDVIMPGKNGMELLADIRGINPGIKAIFLSGYTAEIMHGKGIFEEGMDFVMKPFSREVLLRKVRDVLDRA